MEVEIGMVMGNFNEDYRSESNEPRKLIINHDEEGEHAGRKRLNIVCAPRKTRDLVI